LRTSENKNFEENIYRLPRVSIRKMKKQEAGENWMMWSFIICILYIILLRVND
jgi:hypothetical protein